MAKCADVENYRGEPQDYMGEALMDDARSGDALGKLCRYEAALMNGYTKTLQIPAFLIEVQSGAYLSEDDIVRFDDIYRRGESE